MMLKNGLSDVLRTEAKTATRIVDLFCGGSSVSWFAASELEKTVVACDLQTFAATLASSVISRTKPVQVQILDQRWLSQAARIRNRQKGWKEAEALDSAEFCTKTWRKRAQELCSSDAVAGSSIISRSYGGHYFSPTQALSFDAMLKALPEEKKLQELCLSATIIAASRCVAAPGHTAQPFKATQTASKFLREAWQHDPFDYVREALKKLCPLHASKRGRAIVKDANLMAGSLKMDDVVFVDPPYSSVQYSRFYHVLETIARGTCNQVEGIGRYPPYDERPNSDYSRKGASLQAITELLRTLATKKCTVILTFPKGECSNGLSGERIEEIAHQHFRVTRRSVKTRFSTLGGNKINRVARKISDELMLVLK